MGTHPLAGTYTSKQDFIDSTLQIKTVLWVLTNRGGFSRVMAE